MERKNESKMFSAVMYLSLVLGALICAGINPARYAATRKP